MDDIKKKFLAAYEENADAIYRHCFFRVFSRTRAEELTQETFMRAWQYLSDGKRVDNLRAFLYRISSNLIIDNARKKKETSLDKLLAKSHFFEPSHDPRADLGKKLLLKEIMEEMQKLPEELQKMITMRYVDDMGPKEIAEILEIAPNNVSVKINRAIKALRDILDDKNIEL